MGLRIIDRRPPVRAAEPTEAERLAGLTAAARHWAGVKGLNNLDIQAAFIDNFRRAKARLDSPAEVEALAGRVRDLVLGRPGDAAQPHGQVDVATLMVLL